MHLHELLDRQEFNGGDDEGERADGTGLLAVLDVLVVLVHGRE